MTHLSVNVNKLATLRNARGKNSPDVTALARKILTYGAFGITVHPRPDGRHIRTADVHALKSMIEEWNLTHAHAEYNIEGYPAPEFLELVAAAKPDQATLVPDPPEAITSNAGWNLAGSESLLEAVLKRLRQIGVRASLFVDPFTFDERQAEALERLRPDRIELYTEKFADDFDTPAQDATIAEYARVARFARSLEIGINAGHDLSQANLALLVRAVPEITEVSIGHALVCEALEQGLETTVRSYLRILRG